MHFQAPDAGVLDQEMDAFIAWFNREDNLDPVLKAAIELNSQFTIVQYFSIRSWSRYFRVLVESHNQM